MVSQTCLQHASCGTKASCNLCLAPFMLQQSKDNAYAQPNLTFLSEFCAQHLYMLCFNYAQIATKGSNPLICMPSQIWEQYPQRVTAIEPSDAMIKLAADLQHAQHAQPPSSSNTYTIQWHRQLHPSMLPTKKSKAQQISRQTYDLVVASYVLTEMSSDAARQQAVDMLWRQTKDVLVLIEPGTPSGSAHVRHARTQVLHLIVVACRLLQPDESCIVHSLC